MEFERTDRGSIKGSASFPEVSVILPCFNEEERIRSALRHVFEQHDGISFEVIVVDSSSDRTADIIQREFPLVRLLQYSSRLSAGEARNRGVMVARGDKILFTDADVLVTPDWVERLSVHLEQVEFAGGAIANGTPQSLSGTVLYFLEFFRLLPECSVPPRGDGRFLATANVGYRRQAIEGHLFDDASAGEDIILHHTLTNARLSSLFDPSLAVVHLNRVGWRAVIDRLQRLGEGGHRWRSRVASDRSLSLRFPQMIILKPFAVVGWLIGHNLWRRNWYRALQIFLLSPLLVTIDFFWVVGFLGASHGRH